jgi:hypothetical protein
MDWSPVVSISEINCEDIRGELNEIRDETVPTMPEALAATDNDLDAPEGTFWRSVESLTHTVASEDDRLTALRWVIPVLENFVPSTVKLTDPDTGDTQKGTLRGAGAVNDIVFETNEKESNVAVIDKLDPKPLIDFATMVDSDTHKWNPATDEPRRIFWEYDAAPNSLPKRVTKELPEVGTNDVFLEIASTVLYEAHSISDEDFWRETDTVIPTLVPRPIGILDVNDESDRHSELKESDLWNLVAVVKPCAQYDEPMIVNENDPDLARFVIVKADIVGAVADIKLADAEPTLTPTLVWTVMDKPTTTWARHETEESEVHNETGAWVVLREITRDECSKPNPNPYIDTDTAPEVGNVWSLMLLMDELK